MKYNSKIPNLEIIFTISQSTLGLMLVAKNQKGICALFISNERSQLLTQLHSAFTNASFTENNELLAPEFAQINQHLNQPKKKLPLSINLIGTPFQREVWQELTNIPIGTTVSYSQLAEKIGRPKAVRAVANACANNNIAILIPCHRVIRKNGELANYRWGIQRKQALLTAEAKSTR